MAQGSSEPSTATASARCAHRPGPAPTATLSAEQYLCKGKWLMDKSELNCKHEIKFPSWMTLWVSVSSSATKQLLLACSSRSWWWDYRSLCNKHLLCISSAPHVPLPTGCSGTGCPFVTWLLLHTTTLLDRYETELLFVPFQTGKCSFKLAKDPWHSERKRSLQRKSEKNLIPLV